jgi:hypothetical protein
MGAHRTLPPISFRALITSGGRTIETTIVRLSRYGYHTTGCGVVQKAAITPIAVQNEFGRRKANASLGPLFSFSQIPKSDKPFFDEEEWRARKPKTERDFWKDRTQRTRAWLLDVLKSGPLPTLEILRRAKLDDIPERGLRRAKRRLGVVSFKRGGRDGREGAVWFWRQNSQECRR